MRSARSRSPPEAIERKRTGGGPVGTRARLHSFERAAIFCSAWVAYGTRIQAQPEQVPARAHSKWGRFGGGDESVIIVAIQLHPGVPVNETMKICVKPMPFIGQDNTTPQEPCHVGVWSILPGSRRLSTTIYQSCQRA